MLPPVVTGSAVFATLFVSALIGRRLRTKLPDHHLSPDTKDTVRVAMGMVATMAALVLGLLVAAAKSTWDDERSEITQSVARIRFLDGILYDYGPEAVPIRCVLRRSVEQAVLRAWPDENPDHVATDSNPYWARDLPRALQALSPQNDQQRFLRLQALGVAGELGQIRWMIAEQSKATISRAILLIVVVWMSMIFVSLGVFAPPNATSAAAFAAAAISVAGATFLILELSRPFVGIVRISSEPLRTVLTELPR